MKKIIIVALVSVVTSLEVHAQTAPPEYVPPSKYIALGQFDALFDSIPDAMSEYDKNQALANFNSFLGRTDLSSTFVDLPSADTCNADEAREQAGGAWVIDHAKDVKVIMFNENHFNPASRAFVLSHLQKLKAQGFTHIGFEALPHFVDEDDPEQAIATGYYTIEPMFSALIREAARLDIKIFGYESPSSDLPQGTFEEQRNAREQFQVRNITKVINVAPPGSKFIIYAGWSHIAETPLPDSAPAGNFRWMASLFKEQSGIDPFTVELTSCIYPSHNPEPWQGKIFFGSDSSPLIQGQYAGAVDAQIYLPAPTAQTQEVASYYRAALGTAFRIPATLRSDIFPVLVQARLAGSNRSGIAHDRILLRPAEDFPLFLNSGVYEITSYKGDGSIVGEETVTIE